MSVARQLYQLQEIELALEANEQAQTRTAGQIGESQEAVKARARLAAEQKRIEELAKQQKSTEWEVEDLTIKIKNIDKKLYNGKIFNAKELSNLQAEAEDFKKHRFKLEDVVLELMEQSEQARKNLATITAELARMEEQWRVQQKQLAGELEQLKSNRAALEAKKQVLLPLVDTGAVTVYRDLRKRKGIAIARIEQGTCLGCRITLPNADLQQAKGGGLVKCSSCGRILYLP
ncbi:MAG: C4-type zinc ribbon domain-containing protein [Dehalococcoidia bacterium]|nr:C4-type zinc ribbon domain-containing protein [Dehalococcoidia bacterium]